MPVLRMILYRCLLVLLLPANMIQGQRSLEQEYHLKAVFLFNFTQFIQWPPGAFPSEETPFVIGVLGKNPFGSYLDDVVSGEKVNGHTLKIDYFKSLDEIKDCHILFIDRSEIANQPGILSGLKGKNILTVSDTPNFMEQGGMIRFFTKNNKIQLQINLDAVKMAQLDVSSKLLRLAEIYVPR